MSEFGLPKFLCHYTKFDAMQGILEKKELWLNNILFSNDASEAKYYLEVLKKDVCHRLEEEEKENEWVEMEKKLDEIIKTIEDDPVFSICFSTLDDDASQWARYSDHGTGVCIKFNYNNLNKIRPENCQIQQMIYDEMQNRVPLCDDLINGSSKNHKDILNLAQCVSMLFKHPSFKNESEYRLRRLPKILQSNKSSEEVTIKFSVVKDTIFEHYVLDMKELCSQKGLDFEDLFEGIIIGPRSKVTVSLLKRYLESIGLNKLVGKTERSDCPLQ